MKVKPYLVGIAGGSASGKTSFLMALKNSLPPKTVSIITQDNYYLPIEEQQKDENGEVNFDLPTSINRQKFHEDLGHIMNWEPITIKEYTFNNSDKTPGLITIEPRPIVIMEGLFIFHFEEIRKALDLRVFIDVREHKMLERRLKRDHVERGYNEESVRYQWDNHVVPSYKKYLKPYRDDSHIIVTNNSNYAKGLDVITNHLRSKLISHFYQQ
jgi:uridine kinase